MTELQTALFTLEANLPLLTSVLLVNTLFSSITYLLFLFCSFTLGFICYLTPLTPPHHETGLSVEAAGELTFNIVTIVPSPP